MVNPNRGFNCYFAMPFEHARIVLRNDLRVTPAFQLQIDYTEYDRLPADTMRFHAQWRRQRVTELAHDYVVLDGVEGHGTYVGTYLALTALESRWWGEGEFKFYIDGDGKYSHCAAPAPRTTSAVPGASPNSTNTAAHTSAPSSLAHTSGFPFYWQNSSLDAKAPTGTLPPVTAAYTVGIPDRSTERDLRVEWQQIGTEEAGNFERQTTWPRSPTGTKANHTSHSP